jgi:hypothetical protein
VLAWVEVRDFVLNVDFRTIGDLVGIIRLNWGEIELVKDRESTGSRSSMRSDDRCGTLFRSYNQEKNFLEYLDCLLEAKVLNMVMENEDIT